MCGRSKGFSLIEILVVMAIIGIVATFLVPNFSNLLPRRQREAFFSQANALMLFAWQQALITHKVHKVSFNIQKKLIAIQAATGVVKGGNPEFAPIKGAYMRTTLAIPSSLKIINIIIEGFDEMSRYGGGRETAEVFFFIMPEGLTQQVTINGVDMNNKTVAGKPRPFGLVLNPFNAQFAVYDSFQK